MDASRLSVAAAIVAVAAWGLKAVAIAVAGGLDRSPLEGPFYLLGLAAIVVASASLGVAVSHGRPLAVRVVAAVLGVLIGLALSMLASVVADAVVPDSAGWVQAEAGLWFAVVVVLAATIGWRRARGTPRAGAPRDRRRR